MIISTTVKSGRIWKDEETEFLKQNYQSMGADYCCKKLCRSRGSVLNKANRLGITYLFEINKLEAQKEYIIRDYNSGTKLSKIAEKYYSTVNIISTFLRKHKVERLSSKHKYAGEGSSYWKGFMDISGSYWGGLRKGARVRSLEHSITIEYAWNIFIAQNRKCALSGIPIEFYKPRTPQSSQTASLDRIDPSKGYIEGNVQWVHKTINKMKMNLSQDEFIQLCCDIANNYKGKI